MSLVASSNSRPVVAHHSIETLIHPHIQGNRATGGRSPTLLSKAHRGSCFSHWNDGSPSVSPNHNTRALSGWRAGAAQVATHSVLRGRILGLPVPESAGWTLARVGWRSSAPLGRSRSEAAAKRVWRRLPELDGPDMLCAYRGRRGWYAYWFIELPLCSHAEKQTHRYQLSVLMRRFSSVSNDGELF